MMHMAAGLGAQLANVQADWLKLVSGHFAMQKGEPFSLSILPRAARETLPVALLPTTGTSEDVFATLNATTA